MRMVCRDAVELYCKVSESRATWVESMTDLITDRFPPDLIFQGMQPVLESDLLGGR